VLRTAGSIVFWWVVFLLSDWIFGTHILKYVTLFLQMVVDVWNGRPIPPELRTLGR
jgi:hypothetical protein